MAPVLRVLGLSVAALGVAACSGTSAPERSWSSAPPVTPDTAPTATTGFPTASSTGVADGVSLSPWVGPRAISQAQGRPVMLDGERCILFDRFELDLGEQGEPLVVDEPCVILRDCSIHTPAPVSNTSAMVQQLEGSNRLVIERCEFDGGAAHARSVQGSSGGLVVRASRFERFGNAAIEFSDTTGTFSLDIADSFFEETPGWSVDDHVDGIQVEAGGAVSIVNNTVLVAPYGDASRDPAYGSNSAIAIWAELGDVTGTVTIEGNLLAGGAYVLFIEEKDPFRFHESVNVTANVFDRRYTPVGGIWGILAMGRLPDTLVWSDNRFDDGQPAEATATGAPG